MIKIVVVMIVCITIMIKGIFSIHRNKKELKELEERLDEYYKRRENKILNKFRDIEQ
jgi:hypothetical protein